MWRVLFWWVAFSCGRYGELRSGRARSVMLWQVSRVKVRYGELRFWWGRFGSLGHGLAGEVCYVQVRLGRLGHG